MHSQGRKSFIRFPGTQSIEHMRAQNITLNLQKVLKERGVDAAVRLAHKLLAARQKLLNRLTLTPSACIKGISRFLPYVAMFSIKDTEILLRGLLSYCMPQNSERYDPTLLYKLVSTLMHKEKLASRLNARAQAPVLTNLADANIHAAFKAVDVLFESFQHNPAEQKKCLNACLSCYMLLLEGDLRGNRGQLAHYLLNTASKVTGVRLSWLVGRDRKGNPVLIIEPENPGAPTAFARPVYVEGKIKNIEYIGCKFKIGSSMLAAWSSKYYALGSEAFLHTLDLINAVETTFLNQPEKLGPLKKRLQPINDVISDYLAAPDRHKALVPVRPEGQTGNGGPLPDARQNSFYINKLLI